MIAARRRLPEELVTEYDRLLGGRVSKANQKRNGLLHGRWMIANEYPDALLHTRRIGSLEMEVYDVKRLTDILQAIHASHQAIEEFFTNSMRPVLEEAGREHLKSMKWVAGSMLAEPGSLE